MPYFPPPPVTGNYVTTDTEQTITGAKVLQAAAASKTPLTIQGAVSQSSSVLTTKNATGTVLTQLKASGDVEFASTANNTWVQINGYDNFGLRFQGHVPGWSTLVLKYHQSSLLRMEVESSGDSRKDWTWDLYRGSLSIRSNGTNKYVSFFPTDFVYASARFATTNVAHPFSDFAVEVLYQWNPAPLFRQWVYKQDGSMLAPGDIEVSPVSKGVIVKSPNGTRYRITVTDAGVVQAAAA